MFCGVYRKKVKMKLEGKKLRVKINEIGSTVLELTRVKRYGFWELWEYSVCSARE